MLHDQAADAHVLVSVQLFGRLLETAPVGGPDDNCEEVFGVRLFQVQESWPAFDLSRISAPGDLPAYGYGLPVVLERPLRGNRLLFLSMSGQHETGKKNRKKNTS